MFTRKMQSAQSCLQDWALGCDLTWSRERVPGASPFVSDPINESHFFSAAPKPGCSLSKRRESSSTRLFEDMLDHSLADGPQ